MVVNQRGLADVFGVSIETLIRWQKDGMPVQLRRRGSRGNEYETAEVFKWRLEREAIVSDKGAVDLDDARRRLAVAQADRFEIENAETRGSLLRAEDVAEEYTKLVVESRAVLLSGPTRLAPLVVAAPGLVEARTILEQWVDEALRRLSSRGDDLRADPAGVRASSASKRKRVGRPRKKALAGSERGTGTVAH